jgi:enamine deaminase RidA (YjgF/YER057c/UK114 family)
MITAPMAGEQNAKTFRAQNISRSFSMHGQQENMKLHVTEAGEGQAFIVASALKENNAAQAARASYAKTAEVLHASGMAIVHERIFGSGSVESEVMTARREALVEKQISAHGPVTYIHGNPLWGQGFSGFIIHAVAAEQCWTVNDGAIACGRGWRRNGCTYLVLQNINGSPCSSGDHESRTQQARRMLDRAERILRENNTSYNSVVRTWFYLADILDWYPAFNKVRSEKYGEFGIMPGPQDRSLLLPASTGISGETCAGSACTMDLIAVAGPDGSTPVVRQLSNAEQLDAFRYGSAFSRGALIRDSDVTILQVSGTAAIDGKGKSMFAGDFRGQVSATLKKVEALMGQAGAGLKDITAATIFVKRPEYAGIFREMARERGLEEFPAVYIVADVCRDELLFEIDAEAAIKGKGSRVLGSEGSRERIKEQGSRGRGSKKRVQGFKGPRVQGVKIGNRE